METHTPIDPRTTAGDSGAHAAPEGLACPPRSRSLVREFAGDVGFCFLIAAVLTAIMTPLWGFAWSQLLDAMIVNSAMSLGIGLILANLYRWVFPRLAPEGRGIVAKALAHAVVMGVAIFGGGEVALRVLQAIGFEALDIRPAAFQIGVVVVLVVTGATFAHERLRRHAREVELRSQEARQLALRARLDALQARTDPHFLFNTLNTVAGLIEEDPQAAERMLEKLSSVFRYALSGSQTSWVRLEEELQAVRNYLGVEQIRFGERLRSHLTIEPGVETVLIPPLVLQPLVENAVLHGIAPRTEGGEVRIGAERDASDLVLEVLDDGPGPGNSTHRGSGTSLDNLRERLRMIFGGRASLDATERDGGGMRVVLRLPAEAPS